MTAAEQWVRELEAWRIDPAILDSVTESPYTFPPALFAAQDHVESPLRDAAIAALPEGGTVLDVGAGAGAGSLCLAHRAGHLHAVDAQPSMLRALEDAARAQRLPLTTYDGRWPDLADEVPVCDVVVCAHVFYNVAGLAAFASALTDHARELVAVELTGEHPWVRLAPMWEEVHGQPRPRGPSAELAVEVLRERGIEPDIREVVRGPTVRTGEQHEAWVDFTRRQLCLPPERRREVEELLVRFPPTPRRIVVLTWPGHA